MDTVIWLVVSLIFTIAFVLLGRVLAQKKNRNMFRWALAAALFPPIVLVLLFLPPLDAAAHKPS